MRRRYLDATNKAAKQRAPFPSNRPGATFFFLLLLPGGDHGASRFQGGRA